MEKIIKENQKNVIEVMQQLAANKNINCGIDEIEFPDGTRESFYYNGEKDRQAAITFAKICVNATPNTQKAKEMMATCYQLMINKIVPTRIVEVANGATTYLDETKKALYDATGNVVVGLSEEESKIELSTDALELILKEKAKVLFLNNHDYDESDEYEEYDENEAYNEEYDIHDEEDEEEDESDDEIRRKIHDYIRALV